MADEETTEQQEPKKKGGLIKWIILVVLLLVLAGGGYFAYLKFFAAPADAPAGEAAEQSADQAQQAQASPEDAQIVTLPTFLVNLADPLGRRYLKMTMDVELVNMEASEQLDKSLPKVRDKIILLLSSKSYTELASMESKLLLKQELIERLNQVLGGPKVINVYFTELVIQ